MKPSDSKPFADILGIIPLGRYEVPAFPWPWWCWALALDGTRIGHPGLVVPALLLLPAYRWGLDGDLLLRWAAGDDVGPKERLLAALTAPRLPGWERMPPSFSLAAAVQNFSEQVEAASTIAEDGAVGLRKVALSRPWCFTVAPILNAAEIHLGTPANTDWLDRAEAALHAGLSVPAGKGRPSGTDMDRSQSLRAEVAWLRQRVGRGGAFASKLEQLINLEVDRDEWPTRGQSQAQGDLNRLRDALHKTRRRIRRAGGVPVVVPHVEGAWPRTTAHGWRERPEGGPEHAGLMRWVGGAWFAQFLRVVVGGSFSRFTSMGLVRPDEFAWADEVVPTPRHPPDEPLPEHCPRHAGRVVTAEGFGSAWCAECWGALSTQALDGLLPGWDRHGQDTTVVGNRCALHAGRPASIRALQQHWCADCDKHQIQPLLTTLGLPQV